VESAKVLYRRGACGTNCCRRVIKERRQRERRIRIEEEGGTDGAASPI
jgi:hypothetical protein